MVLYIWIVTQRLLHKFVDDGRILPALCDLAHKLAEADEFGGRLDFICHFLRSP